ncbi:hypothetical protein EUX98_g2866 [Antrodiella citrinella]|uniref:N-acetyltransferase domain-containing protein n=1 Tax=Antrodiella citrinella TaxID=2447956 RepID=A0A4S4MXU8_9APHY|nr:hypothetical protein EUX98_g2866 [Antrodiella citrinella]
MSLETSPESCPVEKPKPKWGSTADVVPQAQRTKYETLESVIKTSRLGMADDPMLQYINEGKISTPWQQKLEDALESMVFSSFIDLHTAWTIDDGDAFLFYKDPAKPEKRWHKLVFLVATFLGQFTGSPHRKRRSEELMGKLDETLEDALGDDIPDMFYLNYLATTPSKQGRGYGTALCRAFTKEADARGVASYLVSSNVEANTSFYNQVGYRTIKMITLGEDDPTWTKPPVPVAIMLRNVPSEKRRPAQAT